MTVCPNCGHDYPRNCQSAVSVDLHGGCLWCRYRPGVEVGTEAELAEVRRAYEQRNVVRAAEVRR